MRTKKKRQASKSTQRAIEETGYKSGFYCSCGKAHGFPLYILAHWTADIRTTCEDCGRKWSIVEGVAAKLTKEGKLDLELDAVAEGWDEL